MNTPPVQLGIPEIVDRAERVVTLSVPLRAVPDLPNDTTQADEVNGGCRALPVGGAFAPRHVRITYFRATLTDAHGWDVWVTVGGYRVTADGALTGRRGMTRYTWPGSVNGLPTSPTPPIEDWPEWVVMVVSLTHPDNMPAVAVPMTPPTAKGLRFYGTDDDVEPS